MKFTRLGENDIRCVISESELVDYGLDLDDIIERRGRTREFFRQILDMATKELGIAKRDGLHLASAQISVLKDNSLSIIFHEASIEEVLKHLTGDNGEKARRLKEDIEEAIRKNPEKLSKGIRNEIVDAMEERLRAEGNMSPAVQSEIRQIRNEIANDPDAPDEEEPRYRLGIIRFDSMDAVISYCSVTAYEGEIVSSLYKSKKDHAYYLLMLRGSMDLSIFSRLLYIASEYGSVLDLSNAGRAYLIAPCEPVVKEDAYQKMRLITG